MIAIPPPAPAPVRPLTRMARLAIAAALATLGLKFGAYFVTGSVGLLSDAVESTANLATAVTTLIAVWYAARPVDRSHNYGHEKIEFFASAVEGALILAAAVGIGWFAAVRLFDPAPLEGLTLGVAVSLVATGINFGVARAMLRVAREHHSVALAADGRHLMTDVWTSIGVVAGLALVAVTGIELLDPLIGLVLAVNVARAGLALVVAAFDGLMDRALPVETEAAVRQAIVRNLAPGDAYHALRTRQAGSRRFVDFHLLAPGEMTVARAHETATRIEDAVERALPGAETTVHIEPIEEPAAWTDSSLVGLERNAGLVVNVR